MSVETWDEIRTAYHVARLGTVSGAAEALGVHHATVIRHIDALEKRLGARLFQRHARGYTPTEAGLDLLQVAQATEDQFSQLAGRIRGRGDGVTGDLIVTSVPELRGFITPALVGLQRDHPGLLVRFLTDQRLFRLEYGEAHVAIRAGSAPDQPDNVVQPFVQLRHALYATRDYLDAAGLPESDEDFSHHRFVGSNSETRAPFFRWMHQTLPPQAISFRGTDTQTMQEAVLNGAGIGFFPLHEAARHPALVQVAAPRDAWTAPLWLVTHVDLHRTPKVQAVLHALKEAARGWNLS
ncbi:LysR family transcriptional regulator [Plastorhodobacter daqingensis]|uniref:LysR family transcriptional regulator n=1 Tax=Plastorhodobacter daqingensis TaxID=1387281 RepID=A0ABW2UFR8_9RHOB